MFFFVMNVAYSIAFGSILPWGASSSWRTRHSWRTRISLLPLFSFCSLKQQKNRVSDHLGYIKGKEKKIEYYKWIKGCPCLPNKQTNSLAFLKHQLVQDHLPHHPHPKREGKLGVRSSGKSINI